MLFQKPLKKRRRPQHQQVAKIMPFSKQSSFTSLHLFEKHGAF